MFFVVSYTTLRRRRLLSVQVLFVTAYDMQVKDCRLILSMAVTPLMAVVRIARSVLARILDACGLVAGVIDMSSEM